MMTPHMFLQTPMKIANIDLFGSVGVGYPTN